MTMQTNSLPIQVNGANPTPQRAGPGPDRLMESSAGFSATLSRELAARQQTAPPQTAPAPAAQQSKPAQQQSKPAEAAKPANREPVREQSAKAAAKPAESPADAKPTQAAKSEEGTEETGEAAEAAAAASTPVTDMLAFMASLSKPVATDAAVTDGAAMAAGEQQLTALENALKNMPGATTGAEAAATDDSGTATLAAGTQQTPLDARAAAQAQAGLGADGQQADGKDGARFAAQLRDSQQQAATIVEEAPAPLSQLQAQAAKLDTVAPAAVPGDRIPARVGTQAWDNQISQRIVYMVGKEQAATLTLNPPDLGPVQIVLNVSNDQATVAFSSQQLEVRQALENAMPRLREMMSESGIALSNATVDANVPDQRQQQQDNERRAQGSHGGNGHLAGTGTEGEAAVNEVAPRTRTVAVGNNGMVDLFA